MILDSMGWVEYRSGKLEAALRYLQRARHLMPDRKVRRPPGRGAL